MLRAAFFSHNRARLKVHLPEAGLIVLTANGLVQRNADGVYPFRQDSSFYYLTGVGEPGFVVVLDLESGDEFLIAPKLTDAELIFGGNINCDEIAKKSGIHTIQSNKDGWDKAKKLLLSRKKIYTLLPPPVMVTHTDTFFTNGARRQLTCKLKRISKDVQLIDIRGSLTTLRQIKQPEEVVEIERAIAATGKGIARARAFMTAGITTHQLLAELEHHLVSKGLRHAFNPIIASADETCVLHAGISGAKLQRKKPVLFDVGAESNLYSADISRTYFVDGATSRQKAVHDAVMEVHLFSLRILKEGLAWRIYAEAVERKMGEQLQKLGLITSSTRADVRKYFPHGVSHGLGLDTHDVCDYKLLQENMVITVEPGIYIPEEGFGVRVEDDVLITKTGAKNLSDHIPYK